MKPPSDAARQLLERYRAAGALGAGDKARLGSVVTERALRGDLPRFDVVPGSLRIPPESLWQQLLASGVVKVGAALLAVAGAGAGGLLYQLAEPAAAPSSLRVVPASSTLEPRPPPRVLIESATPPPISDLPISPKPPGKAAKNGATPEATIDDEIKLMSAAQAALRSGDTARALQLSQQHATRFPNGKLATARQVTRLLALCQSGQTELARRDGAAFLTAHPDSPFAERVRGICVTR